MTEIPTKKTPMIDRRNDYVPLDRMSSTSQSLAAMYAEMETIELPEPELPAQKADRPSVAYYNNSGSVEPIDLIHALNLNFDEGNIVKYVSRWRKKDGLQDLYKARTYLNWLIEAAEKAEGDKDPLQS